MRLWSLHPKYLDSQGLGGLWREALLAQHVLLGKTKGYKNHPQLDRFKECLDPVAAIGHYLIVVCIEAKARGYNYTASKIFSPYTRMGALYVTSGQIEYEFRHLSNKLVNRSPLVFNKFKDIQEIEINPLFYKIPGKIEPWEKIV